MTGGNGAEAKQDRETNVEEGADGRSVSEQVNRLQAE